MIRRGEEKDLPFLGERQAKPPPSFIRTAASPAVASDIIVRPLFFSTGRLADVPQVQASLRVSERDCNQYPNSPRSHVLLTRLLLIRCGYP